jgi:hypothetical protein
MLLKLAQRVASGGALSSSHKRHDDKSDCGGGGSSDKRKGPKDEEKYTRNIQSEIERAGREVVQEKAGRWTRTVDLGRKIGRFGINTFLVCQSLGFGHRTESGTGGIRSASVGFWAEAVWGIDGGGPSIGGSGSVFPAPQVQPR